MRNLTFTATHLLEITVNFEIDRHYFRSIEQKIYHRLAFNGSIFRNKITVFDLSKVTMLRSMK